MSEKTMTIYNNSLRRFKVSDTKNPGKYLFLEPGMSLEVLEKEGKNLLGYSGVMDAAKLAGQPKPEASHDESQKIIIGLNNKIAELEQTIKRMIEEQEKPNGAKESAGSKPEKKTKKKGEK